MPTKPQITANNLKGLGELMNLEELAYKKCMMYAKTFKDSQLQSVALSHAKNHRERFKTLLDYLNSHQ